MTRFASIADRDRIESEMPYAQRGEPRTIYRLLTAARDRHPAAPALSFQLFSAPTARACTLTWGELHERVTETANLFRRLGIGPNDTVAYLLPNCLETPIVLLAGATAGIVNPINPLLDAEHIAGILRETRAKVLVTLRSMPKSDVAQKAAAALALAPQVHTVLQVDLARYVQGVRRLVVPLVRPRVTATHKARVLDFEAAASAEPHDRLTFDDPDEDRVAAYFHTGGTTGMPKIARHQYSGMIYNGFLGGSLLFRQSDVALCPLPLFHVFAAYPILMSCIHSGAHFVMPTPAGYRGEGVMDNFWKLVERWQATFLITVPTAVAALVQRPVDADVSTLRTVISGSAPLPVELYNRFKAATGVGIAEGYGLTEATCLVSCNPVDGVCKVGSVGLPLPYSHVRILRAGPDGFHECAPGESGEICVASPGVFAGSTYVQADRNRDLFAEGRFLRTGDLGRIDADGYLWITGRAKDLIIRGGHNIDPAVIENGLISHPDVVAVAAVGQPDRVAGELPCAYVQLRHGAVATEAELAGHARAHIHERAAVPRHIEVLDELPLTAVGKVFKPALRRMAVARVLNDELKGSARVTEVVEDKAAGMTARIACMPGADRDAVARRLGEYAVRWEWAGRSGD